LLFTSLVHAAPEDFRYQYEVLANDLPQPMTMHQAADGRIYFHEIAGKVRILDPVSKKITEVGKLDVFNSQENGLLGMALDPNFATNGWVYFLHSPKDFDGQFISRFTIKDDTLQMDSRKDLLSWHEQRRECCHHAGSLRFGPDGNLYASTGDNTNPFNESNGYAPLDQRPDRDPWDSQKSAGNTNDLRGKILRIRPTPDGKYTIPAGNLFPPGTPQTRPEIYAMGFRNPWRFQVDPETNIVYVGDVGPDAGKDDDARGPRGFDTISQVKKATNLGWPYSRGGEVYRQYDYEKQVSGKLFDPQKPINESPNNTGRKELPPIQKPLIWWPSGKSDQFPMLGTGGRTACAGPVFHYNPAFAKTNGFPAEYDDCLLFFDWQRPFINWARFDASKNLAGIEPFTASARVAQGDPDDSPRFQIKRPVDAFFGKDGCLYVADYGETWGPNKDSRIVKISYLRGNVPPVARATGTNTEGLDPLTIQLSGSASSDPEGKPLRYQWTIQPGNKVFASTADATITVKQRGNYTAELKVLDEQGAIASASVPLTVGNTPPVLRFTAPQDGDFFTPGQAIPYTVEVNDAEDGNSKNGPKASQIAGVTLVSSEWLGSDGAKAEAAPGLTLMKHNDCFNCHSVDQKLVGPPLVEVAKKYKGDANALEASVQRVLHGSTGVWGEVGMLAHTQLTTDEAHIMVSWIYSLDKENAAASVNRGLTGEIKAPNDQKVRTGMIEATFTDFGNPPVNPLTGRTTIKLRSRTVEAESADELKECKVTSADQASGKRMVNNIGDGSYVRFANINLAGITSVTGRASSANAGGKVQLHAGKPDGPVLAEFEVTPTGGWDKYVDTNAPLKGPGGRTDLYVVFSNPGKSGLFNFDSIRFNQQ
jgi:cytochrome c